MASKFILFFSIVFLALAIINCVDFEDTNDYLVTTVNTNQTIIFNITLIPKSNQTLYFKSDDIDFMNRMYQAYDTEWALCFDIDANNITSVSKTTHYMRQKNTTSFKCKNKDDLTIHSHPSGSCDFSKRDYGNFNNKSRYHGIYCGINDLNLLFDKKKVTVIIR